MLVIKIGFQTAVQVFVLAIVFIHQHQIQEYRNYPSTSNTRVQKL